MKTSIIIVSLAFSVCVMSCTQEKPLPHEELNTYTSFSASFEDSILSKVTMDDEGKLSFDKMDKIGIFSDIQPPVPYFFENGKYYGDGVSGNVFYAFYPYDAYEYDAENPTVLKCKENAFQGIVGNKIVVPMVAKSIDNHLSFKQTCGLLHVKIKEEERKPYFIGIIGNSDEAITGRGSIDLSKETPLFCLDVGNGSTYDVINGTEGASYFLSAVLPENHNTDAVLDIYYPIPVMTFSNGFSMHVVFRDGTQPFEMTTNKTVSIERASIKNFSLVNISEERDAQHKRQKNALEAFYASFNGDEWVNNDNWLSDEPFNKWFGVSVDEFGNITELLFCGNNLRGSIPKEIGGFQSLRSLHITGERGIEGGIPSEIGQLSRLQDLTIVRTNTSGTIPAEISNLSKLETLDFFSNKLTGSIPNELGNLSHLMTLRLRDNQLEGTIPNEIGLLGNLRSLDLACNYLEGSIPPSLSLLPMDCFIELEYNYLSGSVPRDLQAMSFWDYSWPYVMAQFGDGIDRSDLEIQGPSFSVLSVDGSPIDSDIYTRNALTLLFEYGSYYIPFYDKIISLYRDYKKKGLEIIGYSGGTKNEIEEFSRSMSFPWKSFRFDGASPVYMEGTYHDADSFVWMLDNRFPAVNVVDRNGRIVFDPYYLGPIEFLGVRDGNIFVNGETMEMAMDDLSAFVVGVLGDPDPLSEDEMDPGKAYHSTDYSSDGQIHTLQVASEGNGIDVIFMGDAYTDRLIADGTYEKDMEHAMEVLFSEEPYCSFSSLFNVYYVDIVSKQEFFWGETALDTYYGDVTRVGGNDEKVISYASKVVDTNRMDNAMIHVIMNRNYYAGTCYMYNPHSDGDYGVGLSITYCPKGDDQVVLHESGGHGFAKLHDEYVKEGRGHIPEGEVEACRTLEKYGWYKNIDFTSHPSEVKWSQFISDGRYSEERIGVYEGGGTYATGIWRPTLTSIMNDNTGGFNAPSRYAIWYRIHKLAYGEEWQGTYEDFVEYDKVNRTPAAIAKRQQRRNYVEQDFEPLAPPVIINKDWRELLGDGQKPSKRP